MGRKKGCAAARHADSDQENHEINEELAEGEGKAGLESAARDEGKKSKRKQQQEQPRLELDRGTIKAVKTCVHCQRPFSWRKKWERCWDEVLTCSNACKRERKRANGPADDAEDDDEEEDDNPCPQQPQGPPRGDASASCPSQPSEDPPKTSSRTSSSAGVRTKQCNVCGEAVMMAYRCRWDKTKVWRFVCRPCWPKISDTDYLETIARKRKEEALGNGVDDISTLLQQKGTQGNPYYVYGGTWKATIGMTKAEISEMQDKSARDPRTIGADADAADQNDSKASKRKGKKGGKKDRSRALKKADEVAEDSEEEQEVEESGQEEEIPCQRQKIDADQPESENLQDVAQGA